MIRAFAAGTFSTLPDPAFCAECGGTVRTRVKLTVLPAGDHLRTFVKFSSTRHSRPDGSTCGTREN